MARAAAFINQFAGARVVYHNKSGCAESGYSMDEWMLAWKDGVFKKERIAL